MKRLLLFGALAALFLIVPAWGASPPMVGGGGSGALTSVYDTDGDGLVDRMAGGIGRDVSDADGVLFYVGGVPDTGIIPGSLLNLRSPGPFGTDTPDTINGTTISAGGGGFTTDADGDMVAKSMSSPASDTNNGVTFSNNTTKSPAAGGHQLYFEGGVPKFNVGGQERTSPTILTLSRTFDGPTASTDRNVARFPYAIQITAVHVLTVGGTNVIGQFDECDSNGSNCVAVDGDITGTAGSNANDDGTLSNPSIDAGDYIMWRTTSVSGTITACTVTFDYFLP